jgi:hypothetical protein
MDFLVFLERPAAAVSERFRAFTDEVLGAAQHARRAARRLGARRLRG